MAELVIKHEAPKETKQHVIFIHGLTGDKELTWQSASQPATFWPNWLGEDIDGTTIWSVGYTADKTRWQNGKAMHLTDRGPNICELLLTESKLTTGHITFVGHSLGGLVIKQILRHAESEAKSRPNVQAFVTKVRKVVFLGTPHFGAKTANLAERFSIFVKPSKATKSLVIEDPNLIALNNWYRQWAESNQVDHLILKESELTPVAGPIKIQIVSPISADPGLKQTAFSVDADHESICKPESRNSEVYRYIKNIIERQIEGAHQDTRLEHEINSVKKEVNNAATQSRQDTAIIIENVNTIPAKTASAVTDAMTQQNDPFGNFATYIDTDITQQLNELIKCRHIASFNVVAMAQELTQKLLNGGAYAKGSHQVRCMTLAWCARILSAHATDKDLASQAIATATQLGSCEELSIASIYFDYKEKGVDWAVRELMAYQSPSSKLANSTAFLILNAKNTELALQWLNDMALDFTDLNADGKSTYLIALLSASHWNIACEKAKTMAEENNTDHPVLIYQIAMALLIVTVPNDLRTIVLNQVPMNTPDFPFAADEDAQLNMQMATKYFDLAASVALEHNCIEFAGRSEDYSLWLRLNSVATRENAINELITNINESSNIDLVLRRFPLARHYMLIDKQQIEKAIVKAHAKTGGKSVTAAAARFYLSQLQANEQAALDYLAKYQKEMNPFISKYVFLQFEVELLVAVNRIHDAKYKIQIFIDEGGTKNEVARLNSMVEQVEDTDPVTAAITTYNQTNNYDDLCYVIRLLTDNRDFDRLLQYATERFNRSKNINDAIELVKVKFELKLYNETYPFLKKHTYLIPQSQELQVYWSWALYFEGLVKESKQALEQLETTSYDPNVKHLTVNLAICSGDWLSLSRYVEEEWNNQENRTATELMTAANLAKAVAPARAKELIIAAVAKDKKNPDILSAGYFLAGDLGWEGSDEASSWMGDAARLSDDNGPVLKFDLKELKDILTEARAQDEIVWDNYINGAIPVTITAEYLKRTLADFYLAPIQTNGERTDLRRKTLIPAFSCKRSTVTFELNSLIFDATVLLTLTSINMLDNVINNSAHIIIPHSTLHWLFYEKQKAAFHQPSIMEDAKQFMQLIGCQINIFEPIASANIDLALEVGDNLAALLQHAQNSNHVANSNQDVVVRPNPVTKAGSLLGKQADLTEYSSCLISCISIVKELRTRGAITAVAEQNALSYLERNDKQWVNEPPLENTTNLYLDSLTVTYLQHANVLDKLASAGFNCFVHKAVIEEQKAFLNHELHTQAIAQTIDDLRKCLAKHVDTGKVTIGRIAKKQHTHTIDNHHITELFELANTGGIVVSDDRFFNQRNAFGLDTFNTPIATSLDLLNSLKNKQIITTDIFYEQLTKLRQFGYVFIPLQLEEFDYHFSGTKVVKGELQETAELRAIREYMTQIKMSPLVKLPRDTDWLLNTLKMLCELLKTQWQVDIDEEISIARSNWLLRLIDFRGWSHCFAGGDSADSSQNGAGIQLNILLISSVQIDSKSKSNYWKWLEEFVIEPLQQSDPITFNWVVTLLRNNIREGAEKYTTRELLTHEQ